MAQIDRLVVAANDDDKVMSEMISVSTVEANAERRVSIARREHRPFRCLRSGAHAVREPPVSRLDIAISSLRAASGR